MQAPARPRKRPSDAVAAPRPGWRGWRGWRGIAALLALYLVFALPDHLDPIGWRALLRLPVELPIAVLVLLACPTRGWRLLRPTLAFALALVVLVKSAGIATHAILGRPFHPMLDLHLVGAGFELLASSVGLAAAVALAGATAFGALALAALLHRTIGWLRPSERMRGRLAVAAAVSALVVAGVHLGALAGRLPTMTTAATSEAVHDHLTALRLGLADRARFRAELADDAFAGVDSRRLLARLRGTDVVFLFVESYGRSTLENPLYAPTVLSSLATFEEAARAVGFGARSAWVRAPVRGGQSWLAHATLLSGLRIHDQRRWESLVTSRRQTLVGDFRRAGWRTLAVLPATRRSWPEGRFYGFDRIYAADDLGYAGEPFQWITMPDQYTLSALQRLELERRDRPAIMATVALISSHAPWTPLPLLLDWDAVGDGAAFDARARTGDAPEAVWRDGERIRAQYLRSIEYVLHTLRSWVLTYGREDSMLVIMGDHQPVGFVAGEGASYDVPIHVLSRDPRVLEVVDGWGWSRGMRPGASAPTWPMEAIRERFLHAFTERSP